MTIPSACQAIADRIDALRIDEQQLNIRLRSQPPPTAAEQSVITQRLRNIRQEITAATAELNDCIAQYSSNPGPQPLDSTLTGTVTLTTTSNQAPGPYSSPLTVGMRFDEPRSAVSITRFTPINTPPTKVPIIGDVSLTVTLEGGGQGTYSEGHMELPLTLLFAFNKHIPFQLADATLSITLTTSAPGGSPVDSSGHIALQGTGDFTGGPPFSRHQGTLTIDGVLQPVP